MKRIVLLTTMFAISIMMVCSSFAAPVLLAEAPSEVGGSNDVNIIVQPTTEAVIEIHSESDDTGAIPEQTIYKNKDGSVIITEPSPSVHSILGALGWDTSTMNGSTIKYVSCDTLNVREMPTTDSEIIRTVKFNDELEVLSTIDGWSMIVDNNDLGFAFVSNEYLMDEKQNMRYLGRYLLTAYCCEEYPHICNAGYPYVTRTGLKPRPGYIAVDPRVIPLHSRVMINGVVYQAEDTGGHIKGDRIDICMWTHKEASDFGSKRADVYLLVE